MWKGLVDLWSECVRACVRACVGNPEVWRVEQSKEARLTNLCVCTHRGGFAGGGEDRGGRMERGREGRGRGKGQVVNRSLAVQRLR